MVMNSSRESQAVRILLLGCIIFSVTVMYYTYMINKEYEVFTNPDGIPDGALTVESR